MQSRSETEFVFEPKFAKIIKSFGPSDAAMVMADIVNFQIAWKAGTTDDDLFSMYHFKPYEGVYRPYALYQIYAGLQRKHPIYRAAIMFYHEFTKACWIYAFKKERQKEQREVDLAIKRADSYWTTIEEDNNGE